MAAVCVAADVLECESVTKLEETNSRKEFDSSTNNALAQAILLHHKIVTNYEARTQDRICNREPIIVEERDSAANP